MPFVPYAKLITAGIVIERRQTTANKVKKLTTRSRKAYANYTMNRVLAKDNTLEHARLFLMISSKLTAPYFVKYPLHAGLAMLGG